MASMPYGCDMIAGRNVVFGVLHVAVHENDLECYIEHQPDPEDSPTAYQRNSSSTSRTS